jgi:tetratricopeptide (TPR) repeat protein
LNVNYIVEGSGQKYGKKFVLRVQLIVANNEKHLWGKSYEQEIHETNDIINIQSQIAQSIASELKAKITTDEKQLINKIPTTNLTAYDFYQQGREEYTKWSLKKAENLYHKALKYDSTFARAYLGLAEIYWAKFYWKTYFKENFLDSCLILVNKSLSFDNQLYEAYYLKGEYFRENGHIEEALDNYDKALAINPNDNQLYTSKGNIYINIYYDYIGKNGQIDHP